MGAVHNDHASLHYDPPALLEYVQNLLKRGDHPKHESQSRKLLGSCVALKSYTKHEPSCFLNLSCFHSMRLRDVFSFTSEHDLAEDYKFLYEARKSRLPSADMNPRCPFSLYNDGERTRGRRYVELYRGLCHNRRCQPSDLVVHAGDNPDTFCCWSAPSGRLPCIRRSSGLFLCPFQRRHMILKELYLSMGYPTFAEAAAVANVSLFRILSGPQVPYFAHMRALGNSMCVAQVGVVGAVLLLCAHDMNSTAKCPGHGNIDAPS